MSVDRLARRLSTGCTVVLTIEESRYATEVSPTPWQRIVRLSRGVPSNPPSPAQRQASKIVQLTEDLYSWLPVATLIDNRVFVVHGGVSSITDLKIVSAINRHQFVTVLQPPLHHGSYNANEWRQLVDLLWSDPRPQSGCRPNEMRGGGSFFGPDVTQAFLRKHKLDWIIRSHECKPDGFEYTH
ncbi:hypothetical protein HPB48_004916 [Haemaphysalis longicornis]|uniref:Serine/threonine specific protein phosphatases domain-containing protein n=1 Tax=Haemaphysalis longicornis TaxID=44386 RepID=A0A9J6GDK7_HAELO|nr:hypothetical protein HPB48_004916 [Haemaphysalis longicornis]